MIKALQHLPTFKLFMVLGIGLFQLSASRTEALFASHATDVQMDALLSVILGAATWIVLTLIWSVTRRKGRIHHIDGDPLSWTRASTSGALHFVILFPVLALPFVIHATLLSPISVAFAGISSATVGITAHLSVFWDLRVADAKRSPESLKSEQQTWSAIFAGAISWTGLLISGALLVLAVGAFGNGLRQSLPTNLSPQKVTELLFWQGLPVGYAIATTILWILRPVHRRMEQIADAIAQKN